MKIEFESCFWIDVVDEENYVEISTNTVDGDSVSLIIKKSNPYRKHLKKFIEEIKKIGVNV